MSGSKTSRTWLAGVLLTGTAGIVQAQVSPAVQVPIETASGWGPVKALEGYKTVRIQGRTTAPPAVLARLFADFAEHPSMFPRVVEGVEILACEGSGLRARYRTVFDPKPGGKTTVESLTAVKAVVAAGRIELIWNSDKVQSAYVNAARGRVMFVTRRTPAGTETLVDYVSAIRPKNSVKGILVESQRSVLVSDARYVIDRLMSIAERRTSADAAAVLTTDDVFNCRPPGR